MQKNKKPEFKRQEKSRYKKLKETWRKPRGMHSKMRTRKKGKGVRPSIGYGSQKTTRGLHPSMRIEIMVSNPLELEGADPKKHAIRIASAVGKRKKITILEKAKEMKLKILNPGVKS